MKARRSTRSAEQAIRALAEALAESDKYQRKFRELVLSKLCRIEFFVKNLNAAQILEMYEPFPSIRDRIPADARETEAYLSGISEEMCSRMLKQIYADK